MKILTAILIFLLIFHLAYITMVKKIHGDEILNLEEMSPQTTALEQTSENYTGTEEEDQLYSEPDMFLRELSQQKLPPLTEKEKIIWSFRLAETNPFL
jgi:DNA-directed RNA polymerase specialized sigma subunit